MNEQRPDPDALLSRVQAEEAQQTRGALKIFFGATAGVGKTYAMLEVAHKRRTEGVDVVVGWVETHGRAETAALLEGLDDVVAQITGVIVRETVPDSILERADEIELIDLPPDDLLQRLREGKVYVSEQAGRALDHAPEDAMTGDYQPLSSGR